MTSIELTHAEIEEVANLADGLVGLPVHTADNEQFAYVKAVHGGYFQLDVPMARDYWLSKIYIDSTHNGRVTLTVNREELDEHRLRAPGIEQSAAPDRATATDRVIGEQEALLLRERMEHDMFDKKN